MPELPEVETIRNELAPWIVGQSFTEITISDAKLVCGCSAEEVRSGLTGQTVESLEPRGKYLIFHLSNGRSLIIHLRMTGSLLLNPRGVDRYARAVFHLSNGHRFVLNDRRRLGVMWLVDDDETVVCKLGPEPLGRSFTADVLWHRLSRHHIPIKAALLDQHIVAGVGNMYADEALFAAVIERVIQLATQIQEISAPTFYEGQRAAFVAAQFTAAGLRDVHLDEIGNVFACLPGGQTRPPLVISAHLDSVFPAETDLTVNRQADRLTGAGIGDNALGVAGLFGLRWALQQERCTLPGDIWLVANVAEEGLGDLKGMRAVVNHFGKQVLAYIVLEGMALGQVYHRGLEVRRFQVAACPR